MQMILVTVCIKHHRIKVQRAKRISQEHHPTMEQKQNSTTYMQTLSAALKIYRFPEKYKLWTI